ncbi:MAG: 4-hydroxybenzoate 3-monooxygenase [Methylobacteriaceae bacterium]|nr:4-hydroxybenzoate 3-monooxygenase [Methylobacteriaceae bacterium]
MQRTQVAIIGAGPAGLLLGQLLHKAGIDNIILEARDRAYVEARIRAGVLEQGTVDILRDLGVSERLDREGLVHPGVFVALNGRRRHIDMQRMTGKSVTVYGQTEVTKDLIEARLKTGRPLIFEAHHVSIRDIDGKTPRVRYDVDGGTSQEIVCDVVAGCDGFHGISRPTFPEDSLTVYERVYPFAWLGILSESPPAADELIYARHRRGFALFSMRSPTVTRNYLQCRPDEDLDDWPDDRIWEELRTRLVDPKGESIKEGRIFDKSVLPMRSFVLEPMRHGRLFLAGDAAHIVPPTGAKGLNLAASDVYYLAEAITGYYSSGGESALDAYSDRALSRVWKAQRFSWWMTSMLHPAPDGDPFDNRVRSAELDYVMSSEAAIHSLAENYVGLPF